MRVGLYDLRVMHFYDRSAEQGGERSKGGLTVVYYWDTLSSYIVVSTAVCSRSDAYNKRIGREIALNNYQQGLHVRLPMNKKVWKNPRNMLRSMFSRPVADNGKSHALFVGNDNREREGWWD